MDKINKEKDMYQELEDMPEFEIYEKEESYVESERMKNDTRKSNDYLIAKYIESSKQKISEDIKKYVSELDKLRLENIENSEIQTENQEQNNEGIQEKVVVEKANVSFVGMLDQILDYLRKMEVIQESWKNVDNNTRLKLRKIFDDIGKVVTEAKIKEDWIFKENQEVNNFLGEYFSLIISVRKDVETLEKVNFGICGGSSKKKHLTNINLKIDEILMKFSGFKMLFRLKPRMKKVYKNYSGKRVMIKPPPFDIEIQDLKDIVGMSLKDFPELKPKEIVKVVYETKEVERPVQKEIVKNEKPPQSEKKIFQSEDKSSFFKAQEFYLGMGKQKNISKAIELLEIAEKEGNMEASNFLGKIYLEGIGRKTDFDKAFHHFKISASKNHPESLYYMGYILEKGHVLNLTEKQRLEESYLCFKKSAELNYPEALTDMAFFFEKGLLEKPDEKKAIEFYKKAIRFENPRAMNNLASIYLTQKDNKEYFQKEAFLLFKKSSDLGNKEALTNLAICYLQGLGTDKNFIIAHELFSQSARNKDPDALFYLAFFKLKKADVNSKKDYEEIHMLLTEVLLLNPNHPDALYYIGYMYENGLGLDLNKDKAFFYYKKSVQTSKEKNSKALYKLGCFSQKKNPAKSNYYFKKSAELGDADAINILGENLEKEGRFQQAELYYKGASDLGNNDAKVNLAMLKIKENNNTENYEDFLKEAAETGHKKAQIFLNHFDQENKENMNFQII